MIYIRIVILRQIILSLMSIMGDGFDRGTVEDIW